MTGGAIETPAWAVVGCCKYTRCVGVPGFTVNELLVPVRPELPLSVAVIVKLPVLVIVTLWLLRTPLVNAGVVTGAPTRVPVEVSFTLKPLPL